MGNTCLSLIKTTETYHIKDVFLRFCRRLDKVSASYNADGVQKERLKQTYAQDRRKIVALVASFTFLLTLKSLNCPCIFLIGSEYCYAFASRESRDL